MFHGQTKSFSKIVFFSLLCIGFALCIPTAQANTNCVCMSSANDCQSMKDVAAGGCTVDACTKTFGKDFTVPNIDVGGVAQSACDGAHAAYTATTDSSASGSKTKKSITPNLNVQIPGLKFTDAISGTCTGGKGQCIKTSFLADYINAIYSWMLGAGITIAIVLIMVGGMQYTLSAGGSDVGKAKERITNAVSGLILLLFVFLILHVINPQLTQLKTIELQNIPLQDIDSGSEEG